MRMLNIIDYILNKIFAFFFFWFLVKKNIQYTEKSKTLNVSKDMKQKMKLHQGVL